MTEVVEDRATRAVVPAGHWLERLLPKAPPWLTTPLMTGVSTPFAADASLLRKVPAPAPAPVPVPVAGSMTHVELERRVEDIALSLGSRMTSRRAARDPEWGELADVLDDVLDVLEAVRALPAR